VNYNIVSVPRIAIDFLVQMNIAHDAVGEARRKNGFSGMMDVSFEIGRKPKRYIRRFTLNFEIKVRSGILATLWYV
jgi:hypothetical protein